MDDAGLKVRVEKLHGPARLVGAKHDPRVGAICHTYVVRTPRGDRLVRAWRTMNGIVVEYGRTPDDDDDAPTPPHRSE